MGLNLEGVEFGFYPISDKNVIFQVKTGLIDKIRCLNLTEGLKDDLKDDLVWFLRRSDGKIYL